MSANLKHLVLENDVHRALCKKKESTGVPIREIGNSALRSALTAEHVVDIVGNTLVSMGKLSGSEYAQILNQATLAAQEQQDSYAPPVYPSSDGSLISGSWKIARITTDTVGLFQILECWARDDARRPMDTHRHDADEYVIVLEGKVLILLSSTPCILGPRENLRIPSGCLHSGTPLDANTHMLAILAPADPAYAVDAS